MSAYDFSNVSFITDSDGRVRLDRDFDDFPPTEAEVTDLAKCDFVASLLLYELLHHVALGNLQVASGLDGIPHLSVGQFLRRVDQFMVPQAAKQEG